MPETSMLAPTQAGSMPGSSMSAETCFNSSTDTIEIWRTLRTSVPLGHGFLELADFIVSPKYLSPTKPSQVTSTSSTGMPGMSLGVINIASMRPRYSSPISFPPVDSVQSIVAPIRLEACSDSPCLWQPASPDQTAN